MMTLENVELKTGKFIGNEEEVKITYFTKNGVLVEVHFTGDFHDNTGCLLLAVPCTIEAANNRINSILLR